MAALGALEPIQRFFQPKDRADISNTSFTLHKWTAVVLLSFSILTTSSQMFGDPIHCHLDHNTISQDVFEAFCWMSSTHTMAVDSNSSHLHSGVGQGLGREDERNSFHSYYQWVSLFLVLQAAACYTPWGAWKRAEDGRVGRLLARVSQDPLTETPVEEQVASLGAFLLSHPSWYSATALKLLLCQAACLLNCLAQLLAMDLLFGGQFLSLGFLVQDFSTLSQSLLTVFPRVVICTMEVFGPTGQHVNKSGICVLPINTVNEKIFLALWFWFMFLALVSLLQLILEAGLLVPSLRPCLSSGLSSTLLPPRKVQALLARSSHGDTVLLQLLATNCDSSQFSALARHLLKEPQIPQHHRLEEGTR